jgi:hypothetical protein
LKAFSSFCVLCALLCGISCSEQKDSATLPDSPTSTPLIAKEPAATQKPVETPKTESQTKTQLAIKILTVSGHKRSSEQMINNIAGNMPEEQMVQFLKMIDIDEFMLALSLVYSKRFNPEELQDIIDYYKSPVGVSFAKKRPAMMTMCMKAGQTYRQKRMAGQPVTLPIPGEGKDDPLRNAVALMNASGEAAAAAEAMDMMNESLKLTNPDVAQKLAEVIDPDDINLITAKVMADMFSVEELQSMIRFYGTATGKILSKHMPAIMRESGDAGENYFKDKLQQ